MPLVKEDLNYKMLLQTRREMIGAVLVALAAVVVTLAVTVPQIGQALEARESYAKQEPKVAKLRQKLANLDNVQFTPEYTQEALVDDALPSKKPLLELLTSLSQVTEATDVTIEEFAINPGEIASDAAQLQEGRRRGSSGPVDSLEVEMQISGSFDQLQQFFSLVEKVAPFTTITKLRLGQERSSRIADQGPVVDAQLTTQTYFFVQPVAVTVDAALPSLTPREVYVLEQLQDFSLVQLPEQTSITGGGLQDLFGVEEFDFE